MVAPCRVPRPCHQPTSHATAQGAVGQTLQAPLASPTGGSRNFKFPVDTRMKIEYIAKHEAGWRLIVARRVCHIHRYDRARLTPFARVESACQSARQPNPTPDLSLPPAGMGMALGAGGDSWKSPTQDAGAPHNTEGRLSRASGPSAWALWRRGGPSGLADAALREGDAQRPGVTVTQRSREYNAARLQTLHGISRSDRHHQSHVAAHQYPRWIGGTRCLQNPRNGKR